MRRHYAVTYDVSDDKRRNEVFKTLLGFGSHAQYSVFFCELSQTELVRLRSSLRGAINEHEDQVIFIDLGRTTRALGTRLEVLGKPYDPPARITVL